MTNEQRQIRLVRALDTLANKPEARVLPDGLERRSSKSESRAEKDHEKTYLIGRAASYGVLSQDLGFYEKLQYGCFDKALAAGTDIVHKMNHDDNLILGRTATGSTVLTSKSDGLYYKTLLPATSYVRDMMALMERGDFNESSFAFEVGDEEWDTMPDPANPERQVILRTITNVKRLWDVATCYMGAYPDTDAQLSDRALPVGMPREYRALLRDGNRHVHGGHISDEQRNLYRRARLALASSL
jgi:Escherichia/Staphylococcus phage prohead protease